MENGGDGKDNFSILLLSRPWTKPTKWGMRPAKTQISLSIRPSLSKVFAVRMKN